MKHTDTYTHTCTYIHVQHCTRVVLCIYIYLWYWRKDSDAVALLIRHPTCDLQVTGSSPGWVRVLCASVTKQ